MKFQLALYSADTRKSYVSERRGLGIHGIMNYFMGKPTFSGAYDEDLESIIGIFETMADMCGITEEEC